MSSKPQPESTRPAPITGDAAAVARHYDEHFVAESARLEKHYPVEYGITARYLLRFIPERATVAEIGVGGGHYTELLARRGCTLHLVDVSERLLHVASERLHIAGLGGCIESSHRASAISLPLPDASLDAILLLGPLYHLRRLEERQAVIREAVRVLKPGGIVIAAGISRLPFLRDMFRPAAEIPDAEEFFADRFQQAQQIFRSDLLRGDFPREYLASGNVDPQHAPPIGYAHFTTILEFRNLLKSDFEQLALAGVESFSAPWQSRLNDVPAEEAQAWLDLIERTGRTAEGLACSDHFLFVGKCRKGE